MLGHGLLAFAFVASVAAVGGWSRERALAAGLIAGGFAVVPDADMVYALVGPLQADAAGVIAVTNAFWGASTLVHRAVTHSVVIAVPAAIAFGLWSSDRSGARAGAITVLAGAAAVGGIKNGALGLVVFVAFALVGMAVAAAARRRTDLTPLTVGGLALFGLVSHPFGDLFTGEPPRLLYPLAETPFVDRIALHPDPTLHLLATFGLEVVAVWIAVGVVLWLSEFGPATDPDATPQLGRRRRNWPVAPHAALGAGYAGAVVLLPAPTLSVSYHFVFSIVGVGVALAVVALRRRGIPPWRPFTRPLACDAEGLLAAVLTGTAAVTVALAAYATAYVVV